MQSDDGCQGAEMRRCRWMRLAQAGDRDAYRALLDDVGPLIRRFMRRHVHRDDVEDAYQEAFLSLHRYRHTYRHSRPVTPWLFTIARHVAIDVSQRRRLRAQCEIAVERLPERGVELEIDHSGKLVQALEALTPNQRQALALVRFDGLTVREAAARAGTTVGAFKVRSHRASRALKAMLKA